MLGGSGQLRRCQNQDGTNGQGREDFLNADVEGAGSQLQHPVATSESVLLPGGGGVGCEGPVLDYDTLGAPGGTRGIENIGGETGIWENNGQGSCGHRVDQQDRRTVGRAQGGLLGQG
jgi:hypothetical protein